MDRRTDAGAGRHTDTTPDDPAADDVTDAVTDTVAEAARPVPDDAGFATWYAAVADGVTRRVGAAVGDPLLGREAAAEAFARAYERWPRVAAMDSPEGWVHRVAVNVCRRAWRQHGLESRALVRSVPPELVAPQMAGEHHDDLYRAVRRLPARHRTVLRLRYWDDLTEPQIAAKLDLATGTVSSLLHQARAKVLRALPDFDPRPHGGTP